MAKKVLFIDRDGTIIVEPRDDFQIDSYEKFEFVPHVISALKTIVTYTDYELVMVTNQDGLGTDSLPKQTFWPVHNMMLSILKKEGIEFSDIIIDRSFPHEQKPTRKPGTALLQSYFSNEYDMTNSFVIGDRNTDIELAINLGARAIVVPPCDVTPRIPAEFVPLCDFITCDWNEISNFLVFPKRT